MRRSRSTCVRSFSRASGMGNCARNRSTRAVGTPWVAATRSMSPSTTKSVQLCAPQTLTPLRAIPSKTGCASIGEAPMRPRISLVAVSRSRLSARRFSSSRPSGRLAFAFTFVGFARRPISALDPAGELPSLLEHRERPRRARHQEPVAARDQALDVLRVRMRVAAGHVVVLADLQNAIDGLGHHGVLVLARVPELLAEIPFPDQDDADPLHLREDLRQVLDRLHVL